MQEGTVKFFNNSKGFGFITSSESGEDIFVHNSGLIDDVRENDKVRYDTEQGRKGLNAFNVEVVD
ncbi:cold-shock protein [Tenacibaculum sp.]|uniref:cold-shock protein n=1 Tax=Tenacibaculum sp. TaxID=1906242 RepID=UPI003D11BA70